MTNRDRLKLGGCDPVLIAKVDALISAMHDEGHILRVTDGYRTAGQQMILYDQGRRTPGPDVSPRRPLGRVVTYCDGVHKKSNHQSGRAADLCFIVNGTPSWSESCPWELFGKVAEALGLVWGGRFKPLGRDGLGWDKSHVELAPRPIGEVVA